MVGVAQLVELLVVVQAVAGSSPVVHPKLLLIDGLPKSPVGVVLVCLKHLSFGVHDKGTSSGQRLTNRLTTQDDDFKFRCT
jgi:hypothetical protein